MKRQKALTAGGLWLLALFLVTPLHGAAFNEELRAPQAASAATLRSRFKAHFETFQQKQQEQDPAAFIRDAAAHRQWSDLYFSVKRALDESIPLYDLIDFGLVANPDGTYTVDLNDYPQWEPLDSRLYILSNPDVLESAIPSLEARGFRPGDADILRQYTATHDPRLTTHREAEQLFNTFARRLQRVSRAGQSPSFEDALAFRYQKARIKAEAKRQWALGLLDALDAQRQRILVSLLEESESELTFGTPSEPLQLTLQKEVQPMISGEYVQLLQRDAARIERNMAQRAQKLMEGPTR